MNAEQIEATIKEIGHWLRNAEIETVQKIHDLLNPDTATVEVGLNTQETQTIADAPAATVADAKPEAPVTADVTPAPTDSAPVAPATDAAPVPAEVPSTPAA